MGAGESGAGVPGLRAAPLTLRGDRGRGASTGRLHLPLPPAGPTRSRDEAAPRVRPAASTDKAAAEAPGRAQGPAVPGLRAPR